MWRSVASNFLSVTIVLLVVLAGAIGWAKQQYSAPGPLAGAVCLRVESGSNMVRLSEQLVGMGALSFPAIFRVGVDYGGRAADLKAGSFLVPAHASMADIVDTVTASGVSTCGTEVVFRIGVTAREIQVRELDPATNRFVEIGAFAPGDGDAPEVYTRVRAEADTRYRVALAEGATNWQVLNALSAADFLTGDVADAPREGMLAPDSYEVRAASTRSALVERMVAAQEARLAEAWRNRAPGLPVSSPEEVLIMASIIEKETALPQERGQVASVFENRLEQGIRLQTDPSVIYGVTDGRGNLGRGLRQSELQRDTPYNTYRIEGLPPTAIANPGVGALAAAVEPDDTDYLFFVADGTGGHAFAATLAEHNRNVAAWRAIEARSDN